MKKKLCAYHGQQSVKNNAIAQLEAHYLADEIVKGIYWQNGKGCAVGCTVHSNDHFDYETKWGIPVTLARIEDRIFERLPNPLAKEFPLKFMKSIKVGADLSTVWPKFAIFLLTDAVHGSIQFAQTNQQKNAIQAVADLYAQHRIVTQEEWINAKQQATEASYAAYTAAVAAASYEAEYEAHAAAAAAAYAAAAAEHAAHAEHAVVEEVYTWAAAAAAHEAEYAVECTAAAAAVRDQTAITAIKQKHFTAQAEKLIQLLNECQ